MIGWHSRGYLPHFDGGAIAQFVTFRLADSLPRAALEAWEAELRSLPEKQSAVERRRRIEEYLDKGTGEAWLRDERIAQLLEDALLFFDGQRYAIHAWVVMPNHVHALFTPSGDWELAVILKSWKSFTARKANRLLGRTGKFWQEEYFDRFARNEEHFRQAVDYIESNPVKAGLCRAKENWRFGSAWRRARDQSDSDERCGPGGSRSQGAVGHAPDRRGVRDQGSRHRSIG